MRLLLSEDDPCHPSSSEHMIEIMLADIEHFCRDFPRREFAFQPGEAVFHLAREIHGGLAGVAQAPEMT
jgi:hypothetical protein